MTVADLCGELGISRSTFYDWRAKRKAPPCFKLPNGELRFRRAAYERWQEAADLIIKGLNAAIGAKTVTYDFERLMTGAKKVKCSEFATEMIKHMG